MNEIIRYTLVGLLSVIITTLISRHLFYKKRSTNIGSVSFTIPKWYYILSFLLGLISLGYWILMFTNENGLKSNINIIYIPFSLFLLYGAISSFMLAKYHKVECLEDEIIVISKLNKSTRFKWSEIEYVKFNIASSNYIIKSHGQKAKLHAHLIGLNEILDLIEQNTSLQIDKKYAP